MLSEFFTEENYMYYDLITKNGRIIDGTGGPAYYSDIAIKDGKIVRISKCLTQAKEIIDAKGLTVTPGFIDSHSHNDANILTFPDQIEKIEQGITTSVAGTCGSTQAPLDRDFSLDKDVTYGELGKHSEIYKTMGTFLNLAKNIPQGSNVATFVGHNGLRKAAMGSENRAPTKEELEKMKELTREAMENGAIGASFGLIYTPGCYAQTDELIEIAKIVAEYNGVVSAHIRGEGDTLIEATQEFIDIVKATNVRGVLSHHKSCGKKNWGKINTTLKMIEDANAEGYFIYCDVYPYLATSTSLSANIVPKEMHAGGTSALIENLKNQKNVEKIREYFQSRWDNYDFILITNCKAHIEYEGKRIPEIAKLHGKDEISTMIDLIIDNRNKCNACYFTVDETDAKKVIAYPRAMICTDSGVAGKNAFYHPRLRGSFPRAIGRYAREKGVVTLEEMIRKITSMPAAVYGFSTKGIIKEGLDADICIFDSEHIIDNATYTDCQKRADGLNYVILGGEVVVENAIYNGKKKGAVLLRRV